MPKIKTLHEQGYEIFVEMGPSTTLVGMGKRCLPEGTGTWLTSLKKDNRTGHNCLLV